MLQKKFIYTILLGLFSVLAMQAHSSESNIFEQELPDTLRISLVTCAPGPEVYQIFGHTAVRVQRSGANAFDLVYNYGVFSFDDDFVLKFTQGHTDYVLAVYDFKHFIIDYVVRGSTVYEQELNLTHAEREVLFAALCENARRENREYRYNFLFDNCATRPRDKVVEALASQGEQVRYTTPDTLYTFRKLIRHYGANYSWLTFGIDLALGRELDRVATWQEHMFVPMLLQKACDEAVIVDTVTRQERPMVLSTTELYHSDVVPVLPPTPFYMTPMAFALILLVITIVITIFDIYNRRLSRWYDTLLDIVMFVSGLVIYFLVFCSEHPATSFNLHAMWLTPFAIIPAVLPYVRKAISVVRCYHIVNLILLVLFAILVLCRVQNIDYAVWPLIAVSALRSYNFLYLNR